MAGKLNQVRKMILAEVFPEEVLDKVQIVLGGGPVTDIGGKVIRDSVAAVTLDDLIYFEGGFYDPISYRNMAILAHEVVHVCQSHKDSFVIFGLRYFFEWVKLIFTLGTSRSAYDNVSYEKEARVIESDVYRWLYKGKCPLKSSPLYISAWILNNPYKGKRIS